MGCQKSASRCDLVISAGYSKAAKVKLNMFRGTGRDYLNAFTNLG